MHVDVRYMLACIWQVHTNGKCKIHKYMHAYITYGTMHRKTNEVFVCIREGFVCIREGFVCASS